MSSPGILLVDDDELALSRMTEWLRSSGYPVVATPSYDRAAALLETDVELLVTKARMGTFNGVRLARLARLKRPAMPVILIDDRDEGEGLGIEARRYGALLMAPPDSREEAVEMLQRTLPHLKPRQRWPRKRVPGSISLRVRERIGRLVDVSYGGFCFVVPAAAGALPPAFEVAIDPFDLRVRAQTIWSRPEGEQIRCGAMLVSPESAEHTRWCLLVDLVPSCRGAPA
jgi:CheY-like chemotaxis protein